MNTNPDESTLALWLEDELTGAELAAVETWAVGQPEQLAAREEIRNWRTLMATALPATEEPPFPDFFNSRIQQALRETPRPPAAVAPKRPSFWKSWMVPVTACAGMILAFWVGKQSHTAPEYDVSNAPRAIPVVEPVVYTPESGVKAEWYASQDASATVIVLKGISAIPDSMDFSQTVYVPGDREIDSTADRGELDSNLEAGQ